MGVLGRCGIIDPVGSWGWQDGTWVAMHNRLPLGAITSIIICGYIDRKKVRKHAVEKLSPLFLS